MSIWRFARYLPPLAEQHRVTLGEGGTPLVMSRRIGPALGLSRLYFKLECCNPTGSFKDRFGAMAVSDMVARGSRLCLATSSGNTGAALAAACAAAGIRCYIAVVDGAPGNKLRNMRAFGATVFSVKQFGKSAAVTQAVMDRLAELCRERNATLQISNYLHSPTGMIGCETLAYELHEQRPELEHVFTQAGSGAVTLAVARGFARLVREQQMARSPAVHCVQPEGNDTIAGPLREGAPRARSVECATTISGLQVPTIIGGDEVLPACRASGGTGHVVADAAIYAAQRRLAREEGILSEPAGATALAGLCAAVERGEVARDATIVCLVTGIGFKDEKSLESLGAGDCPLLPKPAAIEELLSDAP